VERFDPHTPPVPVAEGGHVEIAALSRGFNRMSARVAAMERNRAVMLAGVSHDVRTPLAKLRLAVAMLADRDDAQGQTAHRQVVEIDRVLGQFLEFARGGEGEKPVPTDLAALVRGITEAHAAEGETIAFEAMQGEPVMVRPESMRRAVENLLENAMKYGRSPISVGLDVTSGWAEIAVRDRGPGVAHDALPSLHAPFTRADTARGGPAGTGLGLAIAHQIVSVHGGTLGLGNLDPIGLQARLRWPLRPDVERVDPGGGEVFSGSVWARLLGPISGLWMTRRKPGKSARATHRP